MPAVPALRRLAQEDQVPGKPGLYREILHPQRKYLRLMGVWFIGQGIHITMSINPLNKFLREMN